MSTSGKAVTKLTFASHLRRVADGGENGAFTVITASGRTVLLRLSAGRITSSHCRGRDIDAAIAVLASSETMRYSFTRATSEDKPELIGIDDFLRRIDAFVEAGVEVVAQPSSATSPSSTTATPGPRRAGSTSVRQDLEALAVEVIGPVAQLLVGEALANHSTLRGAIEEIAEAIPNADVASRFLEIARERFPELDRDR